jgi:hypothetical protein
MGVRKDRRAKLTLEVFKQHETVHYCDLPAGVGAKTVQRLIEKGLVEVVDPTVGRYSKLFAWRLVSSGPDRQNFSSSAS